MKTVRYSKQREAIKEYLMSTTSHPTAETIYETIKQVYPSISLGTVYRNLNFLVEHHQALRLDCGDGFDHFDGNPQPHHHFFCRQCGQVSDLKMDSIDHINLIANANFGGKIEGHTIYFYGICADCNKKLQ